MMTKEEFEQQYAVRSGVSVEDLHTWLDHMAIPCSCDYEECQGWQMVTVAEAKEYYATHRDITQRRP